MYFRRSTRYSHLKSQNSICKMIFYSKHMKNEQLLTIEQQWVKH